MMKKIILLTSLFLSGCLYPAYYSHEQQINLKIPDGAQVEYDGQIIETNNNHAHFSVFRSWFDKEVTIKKEGYQDYRLQLTSEWSDEKWADWQPLLAGSHQESGAFLTFPYNSFFILAHTFENPPVILCLPVSLVLDVYNIVIGGPSVVLLNPWKKYEYNSDIQMQPLPVNSKKIPVQ